MDEVIVRTLDEADEIAQAVDRCPEIYFAEDRTESRFPERTYEDGISAFWDWLVGNSDEHPYPPEDDA